MSLFQEYYVNTLKNNYANFEGRARRSEYWYFVLFTILITFLFIAIMGLGGLVEVPFITISGAFLLGIFGLAMFIPLIALRCRRLHDTNKSGWLQLITFVPFGGIVLLVFYCIEGDRESNMFGQNPKEVMASTSADHLLEL